MVDGLEKLIERTGSTISNDGVVERCLAGIMDAI